jgi:hypothetical protein
MQMTALSREYQPVMWATPCTDGLSRERDQKRDFYEYWYCIRGLSDRNEA